MYFVHTLRLGVCESADRSLAGCADGSGSNGGGAARAVEGGKTLFTVLTLPASALLTPLQLEPELSNLKVTDRDRTLYSEQLRGKQRHK